MLVLTPSIQYCTGSLESNKQEREMKETDGNERCDTSGNSQMTVQKENLEKV